MGHNLAGTASVWYNAEIDAPMRNKQNWTFEEAVCAMHERFIHKATALQAMNKLMEVRYSCTLGVSGFYHELKHRASRLVELPDDYTF